MRPLCSLCLCGDQAPINGFAAKVEINGGARYRTGSGSDRALSRDIDPLRNFAKTFA